jgi:glycosyltransferase involved in cell wall biosynthesis
VKKLLFLVLLGLVGFGAGYFYRNRENLPLPQKISNFTPTNYPIRNHSFVIAIIGRNNGAFLEKTLSSALSQKYEKFRILYVDDASDDGTASLFSGEAYSRVELIRMDAPQGFESCLQELLKRCNDSEILVVLGEKDWLAHPWVLQRLNQYYADPDLWCTTGECLRFPSYKRGDNSSCPPLWSGYASLFKEGTFFQVNPKHLGNLTEVLYIVRDNE